MRSRFARALAAGALGAACVLAPAGPSVAAAPAADVAVVLAAAPVSGTETEPAREPAGRDLGRLGMFTLVGGLIAGVAAFILSRRQDSDD